MGRPLKHPAVSFLLWVSLTLPILYGLGHVFWAGAAFLCLVPPLCYFGVRRLSADSARVGVWRAAAPLAVVMVLLLLGSLIFFALAWGAFTRGGGVHVERAFDRDEIVKAEHYFRLAGWYNPLNVAARNYRGRALLLLQRAELAAEVFERSTRLFPFSFEAHYGQALSRKQLGDVEGAVASLRRAQRIRPLRTYSDFATDFADLEDDPHFAALRSELTAEH